VIATADRGTTPSLKVGRMSLVLSLATDFITTVGTGSVNARSANCMGSAATIVGTNASEEISGTPTADVIFGLSGDDRIDGRGGADVICAGDGFDFVQGGPGANELLGGDGDDTLHGGPSKDLLEGGGGIDALFGEGGNDVLRGGPNVGLGIEGLIGGRGDDRLIGGTGLDSAQFFDSHRGIDGNLRTGLVTGNGLDQLEGIEGLDGSNFDDVLVGDEGGNGLFGQAGDDVIRDLGSGSLASGNYDVLAGDDGDDLLDGGSGFDAATYGRVPASVTVDLSGGYADGHGHDTLRGVEAAFGPSSTTPCSATGWRTPSPVGSARPHRGRGGVDTAIFRDVRGPVDADLRSGTAVGAGADALRGIENLWGSNTADTLVGDADASDNVLVGFDGHDQSSGLDGDDRLSGGRGADTLTGGNGIDVCLSGAVKLACES
jgi:Ca2+-binding RTX toxin-like protein